MKPFDDSRYYRANDPAVAQFLAAKTLANMRSDGRGPAFHKIGGRILYRGCDLNEYVAAGRVEPAAA